MALDLESLFGIPGQAIDARVHDDKSNETIIRNSVLETLDPTQIVVPDRPFSGDNAFEFIDFLSPVGRNVRNLGARIGLDQARGSLVGLISSGLVGGAVDRRKRARKSGLATWSRIS